MKALDAIKQELDAHVGESVRVRANRGRNRLVEQEGVLENTYGNIFVVKMQLRPDDVRRVSYSYSDVLTENIELTVCGDDGDMVLKTEKG